MHIGVVPVEWVEFNDAWSVIQGKVIEEAHVTINVNGHELVTIMSTPREQEDLALGFLWNEGLVNDLDDIDHVHTSEDGCCVDVWLKHEFEKPSRRILTSGCGGGVTFEETIEGFPSIQSDFSMEPSELTAAFRKLHTPESLHATARGVHTSGLSDGDSILVIAEDVGRHNTIDKLQGACLRLGIDPTGCALLATGRVSSEMLRKGVRMGCPIIASRNSPTSMSVYMAEVLNVTLVGYVRKGTMRVYTHPERLGYLVGG